LALNKDINKIIHEKSKLQILIYLSTSKEKKVKFNDLKESLNFTSGNLSIQLKKLESYDLIKIDKKIVKNKTLTTCYITKQGLESLEDYLNYMEELIKNFKENK